MRVTEFVVLALNSRSTDLHFQASEGANVFSASWFLFSCKAENQWQRLTPEFDIPTGLTQFFLVSNHCISPIFFKSLPLLPFPFRLLFARNDKINALPILPFCFVFFTFGLQARRPSCRRSSSGFGVKTSRPTCISLSWFARPTPPLRARRRPRACFPGSENPLGALAYF